MPVKVTARDIKILQFINEFGFCSIKQINRQFSLKIPRSYQIMQRLVQDRLVVHERIFHAQPGLYKLTNKGALYTDLPALQRVLLSTYHHDLQVIDLFLALKSKYDRITWISERRLKQEKYAGGGLNKRGHIADAILQFDDKKIAVELELSLKSRNRLETILKEYNTNFNISEVWYYCPAHIAKYISTLAEKMPHVKVHVLESVTI